MPDVDGIIEVFLIEELKTTSDLDVVFRCQTGHFKSAGIY